MIVVSDAVTQGEIRSVIKQLRITRIEDGTSLRQRLELAGLLGQLALKMFSPEQYHRYLRWLAVATDDQMRELWQ